MELYVLNKINYPGHIVTTIEVNDMSELETAKCRYSERTMSELRQEYGNDIVAITWDEFYEQVEKPYLLRLQKPFKEITEEEWDNMLNCLPPMRWHDFVPGLNVFFCSEGYTADLHGCYIKDRVNGKYYTALRSRFISDEELFNDFKNCIK